FLRDAARLFGYRVFDTPSRTRLKRISGAPEGQVMLYVEEGVNPLELTYSDDIATIVNYREVFGADYTDTDGVRVPIRSIAASIPTNPLIYPDGWRRDEVSSELIDTYELADAVRNIYEIDFGAAHELVAWETHGVPHLLPGDVAHVTSDTLGIDEDLWVMSVQHTFNGRGFRTRCEGWRGAGVALPADNDCVTTAIPGGPWHMGDEYLTHYAHPNPMGLMVKVPFAVAQGYSSIAIR